MSDLPQTRSKRSLSPSATSGPSSAWTPTTTARKTSRPNHHVSSTVRAAIPNLDSQQLREVIQRLVDFHPASRETIADILPTIKPSQAPAAAKSTESIYFKSQVDWCEYILADEHWARHSTMPRMECCDIVCRVLRHEIHRIDQKVEYFDFQGAICNEGQYRIDAAIAILDIGLLVFGRKDRRAISRRRRKACSCTTFAPVDAHDCWGCPVLASFTALCYVLRKVRPYVSGIEQDGEGNESDDDVEHREDHDITVPEPSDESFVREWITAAVYATFDGSPHAIRSVLLKYVKLPPMLPHLGPNADPIDTNAPWLFDALRSVDETLRYKRLPKIKPDVVPDLGEMSI